MRILSFLFNIILIPVILLFCLVISPFMAFLKLIGLYDKFLNWLNFHDDKAFSNAQELIDSANSIEVSGSRRGGKSKFLAYMSLSAHHYPKLFKIMNSYVNERNKKGFTIPYPDTPIAANLDLKLNLPGESFIKNYGLQIEDFGVPNDQRAVPILYRGMVIIQDENGSVLDGKDRLPQYIEEAIRKQGHHQLTVIGSNHLINSLSIRFKGLTEIYIHIPKATFSWCWLGFKRDFKTGRLKFGRIPFLTIWHTYYYTNWLDAVDEKKPTLSYVSPKVNLFKRIFTLGNLPIVEGCRKRKFHFWGDIMSHYDSNEKEYAFEKNLSDKTIIQSKFPSIDRGTEEGINKLNKEYSVIRSKDSYRRKNK